MRSIQISIPQPCHEDWTNMLPAERGRFCNSCAKTVVDFSEMSDAAVLNYLNTVKNQSVCGRVHQDQLERNFPIPSPPRKKIFLYWQYLVAFVLMLAKPSSGKAQGEIKQKITGDTIVVQPIQTEMRMGLMLPVKLNAEDGEKFRVVNEEGEPIEGATIEIRPSGRFFESDETGAFILPKKMKWKEMMISAVGYWSKNFNKSYMEFDEIILEKNIQSLDTVRIQSGTMMGGMKTFVGTTAVRACDNVLQVIPDTMALINNIVAPMQLYPNPVIRGNVLKVSLSLLLNNEYSLTVVNASGAVMIEKKLNIIIQKWTLELPVPASWATGRYDLILQNKMTGKKIAKSFLVL